MKSEAAMDACNFTGATEFAVNSSLPSMAFVNWVPPGPGEYFFACDGGALTHCILYHLRVKVTVSDTVPPAPLAHPKGDGSAIDPGAAAGIAIGAAVGFAAVIYIAMRVIKNLRLGP